MLDNANSLSTHASLATLPLQTVPVTVVNTIFTLGQDGASWTFLPHEVKSGPFSQFGVSYDLNPASTPGWEFTAVTIEDAQKPPAWSFTYPNTVGAKTFEVSGEVKVMVTELKPTSIALSLDNFNHTSRPETVSVRLTVSDSQGKPFTSPDPQIILEPR